MQAKTMTVKQAMKPVWERLYYVRTEAGKAEAEKDLQNLVTAIRQERTNEIIALLKGDTPPPVPKEKECIECAHLVAHYNSKTNRRCLLVGRVSGHLHVAHQKYGVERCGQVITSKVTEWAANPERNRTHDLLTIFRPSNFDRYLNQLVLPPAYEAPQAELPKGDFEA